MTSLLLHKQSEELLQGEVTMCSTPLSAFVELIINENVQTGKKSSKFLFKFFLLQYIM